MGAMASQITSLKVIYSIVYSGTDQKKLLKLSLLAFVRGIHRSPVNSPHKEPVTRNMFLFDDVIMVYMRMISEVVIMGPFWHRNPFSDSMYHNTAHEKIAMG